MPLPTHSEVSSSPDQVPSGPSGSALDITPSDSVNLAAMTRALYIGVAGDVSVLMRDNLTHVFKNVPAGTTLPIRVWRVNLTGTSATNMIGLL